jgi:diketogulonate reductase-like aldo/keto reductase
MRTGQVAMVTFPGGATWPCLGLGTWRMGESAERRNAEVKAVRAAIEMGWRVIDTAEMYGEGEAESVVGRAVAESLRAGVVSRDALFVISKVYPHNASARGVAAAFDRSRRRLGLDRIDGYLLHWRGSVPLAETVAAFESLRARDAVRHWGVSNFDVDDMEELFAVDGGHRCAANQIYYALSERAPAFDLLPWHAAHGVVTMAYSPIDQGALVRSAVLRRIASGIGATPAQVALAWLCAQPGVMALPKSSRPARLTENLASSSLSLSAEVLAELDRVFPPPTRKTPLAMR